MSPAPPRYNVPGLERGLRILQLYDRTHRVLSGAAMDEPAERSRMTLATTLMAYARTNPNTIRGRPMPVIVYDPEAGYRAFRLTLRRLRE